MSSQFDIAAARKTAKQFIAERLQATSLDGYVIGLSGGIDSAVSATLAVEAIGADKVMGLLMPYRSSSTDSANDALTLVKKLGMDYRLLDISPMIDAWYSKIDESNRLRAGNKMARERMAILFDVASETNRMVLGTGNRTEICLGYTTWYGDAACSINPVGEFYKTEIRLLAVELDIPREIRDKAPSADLWPGQTDEAEIGVSYETIDSLLECLVDRKLTSLAALKSEGFEEEAIKRIVSLINGNSFKRRVPDIALLGRSPLPESIRLES